MKKVKSTVTYTVPHWNFCNNDNLLPGGHMQKDVCRFCIKTKTGHKCLLYDVSLSAKDDMIHKVRACCKATAGFASNISEAPPAPTIEPKELMKQTIELYDKTIADLMSQGYPKALATSLAKRHILGN